jgi:hypothetical protein
MYNSSTIYLKASVFKSDISYSLHAFVILVALRVPVRRTQVLEKYADGIAQFGKAHG